MNNDARIQAFLLLNKLYQRKHTLDYYLEELDRQKVMTDKRERGLFNALVYGVLRQQAYLDYIIGKFSSQPVAKLDYEVLNLLRLALYQIVFMDKIPASAAVNTAVEIAKAYKPKAKGFVNAVLRKSSAGYKDVPLPNPKRDEIKHFSIKYSLPPWLVKRWLKRFGHDDFERIAAGLNEIPLLSLHVNTVKTTPQDLQALLADNAESVTMGAYAPNALNLVKPKQAVYNLPGYAEGLFMVQDEAAQLTVALVDPQPDEKILDACAGIGGKTLGLAIAAGNNAQITATDLNAAKLERLQAERVRLGLNTPATKAVDWTAAREAIAAALGADAVFDKVLVDAPCSGLGVLRRNPDTKWLRRKADLALLAKQQLQILQNAAAFVKPGGMLVYTVCSTEPEESVAVAEKFLQNNPGFTAVTQNLNLSLNTLNNLSVNNGVFCTYPNCRQMDGFAFACFERLS